MMNYSQFNKYDNYDKFPATSIPHYDNHSFEGYTQITQQIKRQLSPEKRIVVVDCYPGVCQDEILDAFKALSPALIIHSDDCKLPTDILDAMLKDNLTDDRVFGTLTTKKLVDFFNLDALNAAKAKIASTTDGIILVYGVGASLITEGDLLIYCDLARWEIQLRYRKGMSNWTSYNPNDPILSKYKRGFFIEWRIADRHKSNLFNRIDYLLDTNIADTPKMVTGEAFLHGLDTISRRPFRTVPYFDSGVWGGQWMKSVFNLDQSSPNFAWSFDGVPEENSLYLKFGQTTIEIPAIDLVFYKPIALLGERVYSHFGAEFPIRFDLLDTMGGGNLSLQVHPLMHYIQNTFGMHYTQDESYYILEAEDEAFVYLGLKDNVDKDEMLNALENAQKGIASFDAEKYINKIPAKKHDHFLIPSGTIHCSGKDTMVLEISATPYIFTFKLWDWDRLGLDGLPRPIHLNHGKEVIAWDRTTNWVYNNLVNQITTLSETPTIKEERTGLHKREFIDTIRHTFSETVYHLTNDSINVLNLVEGAEAIVESPLGEFEPFIVHFAETFMIPAAVKAYTITPYGVSKGSTLKTIKASIR